MKSVKNAAELKALGGEKPVELPAKSSPAPVQHISSAPIVAALKGVAEKTEGAAESNDELLKKILEAVQQPAVAGAPSWKKLIWNIERDENGLLTRIITERQ